MAGNEAKILSLALKKITLDPRTQPREEMDQSVIEDYAELVNVLPPVEVFHDGVAYYLADGWHRYRAHEQAGRKHILANVRPGTVRDAILFSCGVNDKHGLRRTNADKRRAVVTLLEDDEWGKWSGHEVARRCLVSESMVRQVREELKERASAHGTQITETRLVERDGTIYEMDTSNIGSAAVDEAKHRQTCPTCQGKGWVEGGD